MFYWQAPNKRDVPAFANMLTHPHIQHISYPEFTTFSFSSCLSYMIPHQLKILSWKFSPGKWPFFCRLLCPIMPLWLLVTPKSPRFFFIFGFLLSLSNDISPLARALPSHCLIRFSPYVYHKLEIFTSFFYVSLSIMSKSRIW